VNEKMLKPATSQTIPDVVYHYTAMDALLSIAKNRQVWATSIRYLNDVSEMQHCLRIVTDHWNNKPAPEGIDPDEYRLLTDEETEDPLRFEDVPFVASFSAQHDSLAQWRSYCPNGNGVCIGFSTESLRNAYVGDKPTGSTFRPLPLSLINFTPVQYLGADDTEGIESIFRKIEQDVEEMLPDESGLELIDETGFNSPITANPSISSLRLFSLKQRASSVKHDSFALEREYRLLVTLTLGTSGYVEYRTSKSTLVPYIPVCLPDPDEFPSSHGTPEFINARPYFIDSVTIGPTPHHDLSADAVRGFFRGKNRDVKIFQSGVPYRDW